MSCPDENQLALLGEAALDDATRSALEAHIDRCAACDALVRELAALALGGPDEAAPAVPPRYRLLGRLGSGGMGVVWAAEDRELHRKVALKVVRQTGDRARLVREARLIAGVVHPNVVTVYDVGEHADQLYVAMELVAGTNARAWRTAERSTAEILDVWIAAAHGLRALHAAGIVHRDVKPDNVLVEDRGRVVVCDLGLAIDPGATTLTASGHAVGTPAYMAPEQRDGGAVDARADQYAWCVATWEAITGRHPDVAPAARDRVLDVLARGLAAAPAERWADLDALLAALATAREVRPRRRLGLVVVAGAVAIAAAAIAVQAQRRTSTPAVVATSGAPIAAGDARGAPASVDAQSADPITDAATARPPVAKTRAGVDARAATPSDAAALPEVTIEAYRSYNELASQLAAVEAAIANRDAGCARLLAALPPATPELGTVIAERLAVARPRCAMVADCPAGKTQLEARLRARGLTADAIRSELADADTQLCALAAPGTRTERETRVSFRLMLANASSQPCVAIVEAAEAAQIKPPFFALHAAKCLARAGQCERAGHYVESADQRADLARTFPACRF